MQHEDDFTLALRLQEQFDSELASANHNSPFSPDKNKQNKENMNRSIHGNGSLIDPTWEYIDPTPDIHVLFMQFDKRFFWNQLKHVEVRWSPRMTSCAGVCCYEGRGGLCSVRLSVPLLKLRPRKDLVETLLHEMIHAYLFVTNNDRDRDGHGPEFHKHMYRINKEAGTNITVYHSFHQEVKLYQQHWWRCDGPCQSRPPFFGMVKRSMNRAPGPSDFWYKDHKLSCGGNFIKVREPEDFGNKKVGRKNTSSKEQSSSQPKYKEIRNFFPANAVGNSLSNINKKGNSLNSPKTFNHTGAAGKSNINSPKGGTRSAKQNGGSRINKNSTTGGRGFTGGMLMNRGGGTLTISAKGNNHSHTEQSISSNKAGGNILSNVRTITDVHHEPTSAVPNRSGLPNVTTINGPISKIPLRKFAPFGGEGHTLGTAGPKDKPNRILGRQNIMKNETILSRGSVVTSAKPSKRVGVMDSNAIGCSENKRSALVTDPNGAVFEINKDISEAFPTVNCPVCNVQLKQYELNSHLDTCLSTSWEDGASGIDVVCIEDNPQKQELLGDTVKCPVCNLKTNKEDLNIHLENCIGNVFSEEVTDIEHQDSDGEIGITQPSDQIFPCPSCSGLIIEKEMNNHLDQCLSGVF